MYSICKSNTGTKLFQSICSDKLLTPPLDVYETSGSFVGNPAPSVEETDRLEN